MVIPCLESLAIDYFSAILSIFLSLSCSQTLPMWCMLLVSLLPTIVQLIYLAILWILYFFRRAITCALHLPHPCLRSSMLIGLVMLWFTILLWTISFWLSSPRSPRSMTHFFCTYGWDHHHGRHHCRGCLVATSSWSIWSQRLLGPGIFITTPTPLLCYLHHQHVS